MTIKGISAEFFADLEGESTPFAAAPRFVRPLTGVGDQQVAISSVRSTVFEALLASGYQVDLATRMADEIAASVPTIQEKVRTAA
jgi:hypothetical protein